MRQRAGNLKGKDRDQDDACKPGQFLSIHEYSNKREATRTTDISRSNGNGKRADFADAAFR
jgi:hypothetical protein